MVQDTLIRTLLRAALEETGAQRGLLILPSSGEPRIAAEATRRHKRIVVRLHDEVVIESLLPESVLNYVQHTRESVVIDNAAARATFAADPYVRQHKTGSILCLPLLNQGELVSFLLLENHLATGVFTPARITVLKLVASLAASALENSRLYGELQKREAKTRRLVDANIIGIYVVDIGGPILESNDAYLRMLGYERVDLVSGGLRWTDLTPPEWRTADAQRVERVKRVGRLQPFEKEFFRKDGTRVPVLVGVARLKDPRNQAVVFALDISEQKRMEATALEACMIEQRRIARKLHDALLQNFQGMMFQFQAVRNLIPRHPEEALRSLNDAISEGERSLDESRDKIQNLRLDLEGNLV
jgi:PAS domain S-box-containing protein